MNIRIYTILNLGVETQYFQSTVEDSSGRAIYAAAGRSGETLGVSWKLGAETSTLSVI